jgi:hypothetical protein
VRQAEHIFLAGLVAAFTANAEAGPFGSDYGESEVCADVAFEREAPPNAPPAWLADVFEHPINRDSRMGECVTAFVQHDAPIYQPHSPKE